jgi:hypothetical protein
MHHRRRRRALTVDAPSVATLLDPLLLALGFGWAAARSGALPGHELSICFGKMHSRFTPTARCGTRRHEPQCNELQRPEQPCHEQPCPEQPCWRARQQDLPTAAAGALRLRSARGWR